MCVGFCVCLTIYGRGSIARKIKNRRKGREIGSDGVVPGFIVELNRPSISGDVFKAEYMIHTGRFEKKREKGRSWALWVGNGRLYRGNQNFESLKSDTFSTFSFV